MIPHPHSCQRCHIRSSITLIPVCKAVQLRLEIEIERLGHLIADQRQQLGVLDLLKTRIKDCLKPRRPQGHHDQMITRNLAMDQQARHPSRTH
jgi:hypothetical protein